MSVREDPHNRGPVAVMVQQKPLHGDGDLFGEKEFLDDVAASVAAIESELEAQDPSEGTFTQCTQGFGIDVPCRTDIVFLMLSLSSSHPTYDLSNARTILARPYIINTIYLLERMGTQLRHIFFTDVRLLHLSYLIPTTVAGIFTVPFLARSVGDG
ncbi:hypothetical protein DL764_004634 [Monosporascus ibericus]|uniref:Uncharacterized protein n=1 Tax=Monosporascus ibericus TaxID=155417 RepID=A0A4Q4TBX8_9PEZI|nr:hypothetical protein DL764_004634 [Monosporascus ibericus]